jgi:hypothetical protein
MRPRGGDSSAPSTPPDPHGAIECHSVLGRLLRLRTLTITEEYDRGDKFEHYKRLASLRKYVLVSHRERRVEVWTRADDDAWQCSAAGDGAAAHFASVRAKLDVRELYSAAAEPRWGAPAS